MRLAPHLRTGECLKCATASLNKGALSKGIALDLDCPYFSSLSHTLSWVSVCVWVWVCLKKCVRIIQMKSPASRQSKLTFTALLPLHEKQSALLSYIASKVNQSRRQKEDMYMCIYIHKAITVFWQYSSHWSFPVAVKSCHMVHQDCTKK